MKKHKNKKESGLPPGSLIYTGSSQKDIEISILDYNIKNYNEVKINKLDECFKYKNSKNTTWIDIIGLNNTKAIESIGKAYNIHPLILEDILQVRQRPKIEDFDEYIFITLRILSYNKIKHKVKSEQISIILGNTFVLTFQEQNNEIFNSIRDRIRNNIGLIRKQGVDYLSYTLIDVIVDNYFDLLEELEEKIEDTEDKVISHPENETVQTIQNLKKSLIVLRKSIWPLREVLSSLEKSDSQLIKSSSMYFRDIYDHTILITDTIENYRDLVTGLLDIYLSSISNKMNETMQILTIISTIFIPLSFITSFYGMNFLYMPELKWKYSYPIIISIMILITLAMLKYFKNKKWI